MTENQDQRTSKSGDWRGAPHAWSDPFVCPSEDDLIAHYARETRELVRAFRDRLLSLDGVGHQVCWQGPAWRWTLTFMHPRIARDGAAQFGYLIPHPDGLRFVLPINESMLGAFSLDSSPAYICKTIEMAPHPYEWWWPEWVVQSQEHTDWLLALVEAKHRVLRKSR